MDNNNNNSTYPLKKSMDRKTTLETYLQLICQVLVEIMSRFVSLHQVCCVQILVEFPCTSLCSSDLLCEQHSSRLLL